MDLDEIRKARIQLERDLLARVTAFTRDTDGVAVRVTVEPRYACTYTYEDGTRREIFSHYDLTVTITSLD
jgi:hypothetical protein